MRVMSMSMSGGAGGGPGGGRGLGVVWSVAAGGGVATVSSGDLLTAGVHVIVASYSPQLDVSSRANPPCLVACDFRAAHVEIACLCSRSFLFVPRLLDLQSCRSSSTARSHQRYRTHGRCW